MGLRSVTIGKRTFNCPLHLQRCDEPINGWQVRFGTPHTIFTDKAHGGVTRAYLAALKELTARGAPKERFRRLLDKPLGHKKSGLPVGITGKWRYKVNKTGKQKLIAEFGVLLPKVGGGTRLKNVYIGTMDTVHANYSRALQRAIKLRREAVEAALGQPAGATEPSAR